MDLAKKWAIANIEVQIYARIKVFQIAQLNQKLLAIFCQLIKWEKDLCTLINEQK